MVDDVLGSWGKAGSCEGKAEAFGRVADATLWNIKEKRRTIQAAIHNNLSAGGRENPTINYGRLDGRHCEKAKATNSIANGNLVGISLRYILIPVTTPLRPDIMDFEYTFIVDTSKSVGKLGAQGEGYKARTP